MTASNANASPPPGRAFYVHTIGIATVTLLVVAAFGFAARRAGHPLAAWIPPTLIIMSISLFQPRLTHVPRRPLLHRLAFSLASGVISGALLWALDSWAR
jgi:hypothetical protein